MNNNKVKIILCTFNGEEYIEEQLYSLSNQTYTNFSINIYDDHSNDKTLSIIEGFLRRHPKINASIVIREKNLGYYKNFMKALIDLKYKDDLIFLCDQDDVWLPTKIQQVIDKYKISKLPFFYCSTRFVVDKNLKFKKIIPGKTNYPITFFHLFIQNLAGGNTIAINKVLLSKIRSFHYLFSYTVHDWEIISIASTLKDCVLCFDKTPAILYRQHSKAAIGFNDDFNDYYQKVISTISLKYKKEINMRLNFFLLNKENLRPEHNKFIKQIKSYRDMNFFHRLVNIRQISFCKYRYNFLKRLIWYGFILFGLF